MKKINSILGVIHFEKVADSIPAELTAALREREEARQTKNWARADQLRDLIISNGYLIEDTAEGARLKKAGV